MIDRSNGTNGELSIEEMLERDPLIKELLDEDEVVEYISYKKGILYKFGAIFFLIIFTIYITVLVPANKVPWYHHITAFMLLILSVLMLIEGSISKLVITNKGVIIRSTFKWEILDKVYCTDKFTYSDVKEVGWLDTKFNPHLRIKVKNKKYYSKAYPLMCNITKDEAILLVDIIEKKVKGDEKNGTNRYFNR